MNEWRPLVEALSSGESTSGPGWMRDEQPAPAPDNNPAAARHAAAHGNGAPHASGQVDPNPGSQADAEQARAAAYEEGMALARQEGEALALRYRAAIENLAQARENLLRGCEADLVRLSLTIAREVLMADVVGREQFTQRMVEQALTLMGDGEPMTLRLAPQDMVALRQHKPDLLRRPHITWQEDEALQMGGVVAESPRGRLDASLIARLEAMGQQLAREGTNS